MQCKQHPERKAENICIGCGSQLCGYCTEEGKDGKPYCFRCAMGESVSEIDSVMGEKRERIEEKKQKEKKKKRWSTFQYFVLVSSIMILSMWGFILLGGQRRPTDVDFENQRRVLLFMVDGALKRSAHYQGDGYPEKLIDLVPTYLNLAKDDLPHLDGLTYQKDPEEGYRLFFTKPKKGEMKIILTPDGVQYY